MTLSLSLQVYHDSEEGQRYMMFYQVSEWPHVAILDPRTGECLVTWHKLDAVTFCDLVTEFLTAYPGLDENSAPPKKKLRMVMIFSDILLILIKRKELRIIWHSFLK